jgi:two-component system, NtrC family, response regulator HydG
MKSILIVDKQMSLCTALSGFLRKNNFKVETTTKGQHALEISKSNKFDFVLAEYYLPDIAGPRFFDEIKKLNPETQMILMGTDVHLKNAIDMIRRGAANFLSKPLDPDELIAIIKETEKNQLKTTNNSAFSQGLQTSVMIPSNINFVIGESALAKEVNQQVRRVAPTNFSVVIQGETGTGKESIARMIHLNSQRKDGPFIAVDCGCISPELAGSELFGHQKGSFTGAVYQKSGLFEQANGGTLFMDEIANLPLDIQVGLLRVLQERVIRKIGGIHEIPLNVRIIAATNENLSSKIETADFRADLFYRISEYTLEIPPLRDRMEDLPLFMDFFLEETCKELGKPKPEVSNEVNSIFMGYNWPGNLRELRNTIRRASLFVDTENRIRKEFLPEHILTYRTESTFDQTLSLEPTAFETDEPEYDLKTTALRAEYHRILEVLEKARFNKTRAAEILNIHRKTLYEKLKLLNIPY